MSSLDLYLLKGRHSLLDHNDLCPVVHLLICRQYAQAMGESLEVAELYALFEQERILGSANATI